VSPSIPAAVEGFTSRDVVILDLANPGLSRFSESVKSEISASPAEAGGGEPILIGSLSRHFSIKPLGTAPEMVAIKVPTTLPAGDYTLQAQISGSSVSTAESSTGPTLVVAAPFVSLSESLVKVNWPTPEIAGQRSHAFADVKITDTGNIAYTGPSATGLYVSTDGTVANGTLVRSVPETVSLRPGASHDFRITLLNVPDVTAGNYFLVAHLSSAGGDSQTASTSTFPIVAPVVSLTPAYVSERDRQVPLAIGYEDVVVRISINNTGNVLPSGMSEIAVLQTNGVPPDSTSMTIDSESVQITARPGKKQLLRLNLGVVYFYNGTLSVQVTDSDGNTQSPDFN
jgi:hypothetical protein